MVDGQRPVPPRVPVVAFRIWREPNRDFLESREHSGYSWFRCLWASRTDWQGAAGNWGRVFRSRSRRS